MIAPANEVAIELVELGGDYRAQIHRLAKSRRDLIAQLTVELSFEDRELHEYRWLSDTFLIATIQSPTEESNV